MAQYSGQRSSDPKVTATGRSDGMVWSQSGGPLALARYVGWGPWGFTGTQRSTGLVFDHDTAA
jgi:hypothetical protein